MILPIAAVALVATHAVAGGRDRPAPAPRAAAFTWPRKTVSSARLGWSDDPPACPVAWTPPPAIRAGGSCA